MKTNCTPYVFRVYCKLDCMSLCALPCLCRWMCPRRLANYRWLEFVSVACWVFWRHFYCKIHTNENCFGTFCIFAVTRWHTGWCIADCLHFHRCHSWCPCQCCTFVVPQCGFDLHRWRHRQLLILFRWWAAIAAVFVDNVDFCERWSDTFRPFERVAVERVMVNRPDAICADTPD